MRRLSITVGAALWLLALLKIFAPALPLTEAMGALLVVFVALSLPGMARHSLVLCLLLALATFALGAAYGQWEAIRDGIARSAIFPAFLATIVLLHATAEQRREIAAARGLFGALDPARRDSGLVAGTLLIGSVLQVGVFAILAPILGPDAGREERRRVFTVAVRGMSLVPFWSPFIVAMAVASQYLPGVPLWQIMSLGLCMSVVGILVSLAGFDRSRALGPLWTSLRSFAPVAVPVAVAALVVVGTTTLAGLPTLQALVVSLPVLCLAGILEVRTGALRPVARQTAGGLARIGNETAILAFATTLGAVFEASLPHTGLLHWLEAMSLPPAATILLVILTMSVAGLLGVHVIVTGTFLLVVFTSIPTGVADLCLMQALLVGWGLGSGISISSLSIATGAALFRLPATELVTARNVCFVLLLGAIAAVVLTGLNRLLV